MTPVGAQHHCMRTHIAIAPPHQLFQGGKKTRSSPCAKTTFCLTRCLWRGRAASVAPVSAQHQCSSWHAARRGNATALITHDAHTSPANTHRQLEFGQGLKLAGSADVLGGWDHTKGPDLQWHEGHRWSVQLSLPTGV